MNDEYCERIFAYKSAMAQAKLMLARSIITEDEYAIIDTIMAEKYCILSCSIYRENDLINNCKRGNMSHYKEVISCLKQ